MFKNMRLLPTLAYSLLQPSSERMFIASSKLLWPVGKYLSAKGVQVVVYIHNGIALDDGLDQNASVSALIQSTLDKAGFPEGKCVNGLGIK